MKALIQTKPRRLFLRHKHQYRISGGLFCLLVSLSLLQPQLLSGQSLQLSSSTVSQGSPATLELSLKSPVNEPVALQWEITIPGGQLSFVDDVKPGPAAQAAGKSPACVVKLTKSETSETYTSMCILSGGLAPIHDGVVASLQLQISPKARIGPVRLVLSGIAVFADLKKVTLLTEDAAVTVLPM